MVILVFIYLSHSRMRLSVPEVDLESAVASEMYDTLVLADSYEYQNSVGRGIKGRYRKQGLD